MINFSFDIPSSPIDNFKLSLNDHSIEIDNNNILYDGIVKDELDNDIKFFDLNKSFINDITNNSIIQDEPLQYADISINNDMNIIDNNEKNNKLNKKSLIKSNIGKKGLGIWYFNKKLRKTCYISLTGQTLSGLEATITYRQDKNSLLHPQRSARLELQYLMSLTPQSIDAFTRPNSIYNISSNLNFELLSNLSTWGIPSRTIKRYNSMGITNLFQWQIECLLSYNGASLLGKNLIYSAPTSGGKTLVSEILILRRLSLKKGLIFFIVPFISLIEEKAKYFQKVFKDMYIGIRSYHSEESVSTTLSLDIDMIICTIEKANQLVNQLLIEKHENYISMIVIDELHLLSDSHRGYNIEIFLSKMNFLILNNQLDIQIVGMSATLPNITELSHWINKSNLFISDYRPTCLDVYLLSNNSLYQSKDNKLDNKLVSNIDLNSKASILGNYNMIRVVNPLTSKDFDCMYQLIFETITTNNNIIIFCNSKYKCQILAKNTAIVLTNYLIDSSIHNNIMKKRNMIIQSLYQTPVGLCPILHESIPIGVAYHNAGLTIDERRIVEDGFRSSIINVLFTTSTLSAGVNLPAHRVLIIDTKMGNQSLSVSSFRQMCGRAGRMGLSKSGEAILLLSNHSLADLQYAHHLLNSNIECLKSSLSEGYGGGVEKLLLDMICCDRIHGINQIYSFIQCTLWYQQCETQQVYDRTNKAINFLITEQFISLNNHTNNISTDNFLCTQLGKATSLSGISPKDAVILIKSLQQARKKLILKGGLHPVYLITPINTSIEPDWDQYERILFDLFIEHPDSKDVAEYIGIDMAEVIGFKLRKRPKYSNHSDDNNDKTMLYRRFYSSIILFSLIQEWPITKVLKLVGDRMNRGQLQQLQKDSSANCAMIVTFCKELNWVHLASCLEVLTGRLSYGVRDEILSLVRIGSEMPATRAREFYKRGYTSPQQVAEASVEEITEVLMESLPYDGMDPLLKDTSTYSKLSSQKVANERLATNIILKAKEALKLDLSIINIDN